MMLSALKKLPVALKALLAACVLGGFAHAVSAAPQDTRYVSTQYNVSFQPPQGWTSDILVQYLGPQRADGTRPALNLASQDSTIELSEESIDSLAAELTEEFTGETSGEARLVDRRRISIGGSDALLMELTYRQSGVPMRMRQVYVPASQQKRTYLFTFVDTIEHFSESAPAAESAIASLAFLRAVSAAPGTRREAGSVTYIVLLILIGFAALATVIFATYLLVQRRASAR